MSDSLRSHVQYSPWNYPGQNTGVGSLSLLAGDLPNPRIEPRSPALQADSLPMELSGKPDIGKLYEIATNSSVLAWKIPWTKEPGRSMGSQKVRHNQAT